MAFLSPLFLAGAIAAAVPILLHLFERHTEQRVPFAAVALLKGAVVEHTARRRLREWLLLALRVAALVLLALAFARPFIRTASATAARLTVVAIDTSLSMSAPATWARARRLAEDAVRQAAPGDDVAVVGFADRPDVIVRPTADRGSALSASATLTPGFGATNDAAGLEQAGALFRGQSGAIVIVSDLQASGWDAGARATVPESVRVDVKDTGPMPENASVEALRAEDDRLVATIRNASNRARDLHVRLAVDGRAVGQAVVAVPAGGSADATFPNVHLSGVAAATVDDPSGIAGDNTRYAFVGGKSSADVLVVTTSGNLDKDAWYVRHALASVHGAAAAGVTAAGDDDLSRYGAVIVLSTRGLERRGREKLAAYVSAGGGLLIAAGPDVDGDVIGDVLGSGSAIEMSAGQERTGREKTVVLAPADVRHPIFKSFGPDVASLGLVQFRSVTHIGGRSCQAIARFTSGEAAVLDCAAGNGRALVIASDLDNHWNDFPTRASFLPFLDQAVRYLSGRGHRGADYIVGDVPAGVAPAPGVAAAGAAGASHRVVVNVDPRESETTRMSAGDFETSITRMKDAAAEQGRADAADQENRQHLWQYLLAAMIAALVAEGVLARRTA